MLLSSLRATEISIRMSFEVSRLKSKENPELGHELVSCPGSRKMTFKYGGSVDRV